MHQNPAITFVLRQNPFCRISHRPNAISPISLFKLERKFQLTMNFFIKVNLTFVLLCSFWVTKYSGSLVTPTFPNLSAPVDIPRTFRYTKCLLFSERGLLELGRLFSGEQQLPSRLGRLRAASAVRQRPHGSRSPSSLRPENPHH